MKMPPASQEFTHSIGQPDTATPCEEPKISVIRKESSYGIGKTSFTQQKLYNSRPLAEPPSNQIIPRFPINLHSAK